MPLMRFVSVFLSLAVTATAHADSSPHVSQSASVPESPLSDAASAPAAPVGPSIHQLELWRHATTLPAPPVPVDESRLRAGAKKTVNRIVYGYYPYWVQDLDAIRWEALTHLAWFSVQMDEFGAITARHGWPDDVTVEAAHLADVRVDLAFTLFDGAGIRDLCADPARRATAIANMVNEMEAGNADGISIDFEGLIDGTRDNFTTFVAELREELDRRGHLDAEISIAAPAVNWAGADGIPEFDLNALLDHIDIYFIMGYGYFWSGSNRAGPTGITRLSPEWRSYQSRSMQRTLADYSRDIPAHKRSQIVWGAPYYGREWVTGSDSMGATVIDHVSSVTYSAARSALAGERTRLWDDGAATPWMVWQQDGAWHQVYYEDEHSLAVKYQLALEQDLGGVGMWALNYDRPHPELWDQLEASFGAEPVPTPGHYLAPLTIDSFPMHDERDTADGPSNYFNFYSCAPDTPEYGREWVYQVDVCQTGVIAATVTAQAPVDPDVHILADIDQDACMARANIDVESAVGPGRYYVVVDTWVDNLLTTEGPYALDVDFVPDDPAAGCPASQVCRVGACVCADEGFDACGDGCVDMSSDVLNCGACGNGCATEESCVQGACVLPMPENPGEPAGCGCATTGRGIGDGLPLFAVVALLLWVRRRRVSRVDVDAHELPVG